MKKEEIQIIAFQMISYAGEAVAAYVEALKLYQAGDIEACLLSYKKGDENLNLCHKKQMEVIIEETNNNNIPYSLVMTHAQDHYTTAYNLQLLCKIFIKTEE